MIKNFILVLGLFSLNLIFAQETNQIKNAIDSILKAQKSDKLHFSGTIPTASCPEKLFDIHHLDLKITPNFKTRQIIGNAKLTISAQTIIPTQEIALDAKMFLIHQVSEIISGKEVALNYKYDSAKLILELKSPLTLNNKRVFSISYTANPDLIVSKKSKSIQDSKGAYFINTDGKNPEYPMHLWTQGEPMSNSGWFPTFDFPTEKYTQQLTVIVDDSLETLSNGTLISSLPLPNKKRKDVWSLKKPHSTYLTVLVVGDFHVVKDKTPNNIPLEYFIEHKHKDLAKPIFGRTPEMIPFFEKLLQVPYPWDKYSQVIVREFVSGAMENTTAVTFNDFVLKDRRELKDNNDDETIAHELFHHWFGDLVTCESWGHLTLNESFANYSEFLWHEHKNGIDEALEYWRKDFEQYLFSAKSKREPLFRNNYQDPDDMFDVISYQKGGKILHQLRKYLGDKVFFASLSDYLKTYSFKTTEYNDLKQIFEKHSGQDLDWYFYQWYLVGGHPEIKISAETSNREKALKLSQTHNFYDSFVYRLPLKLTFHFLDNLPKQVHTINFNEPSMNIAANSLLKDLPYKDKLKVIEFDSDNALVGRVTEKRDVADWVALLQIPEVGYLTKYRAIKSLSTDTNAIKLDLVQATVNEVLKSKQSDWIKFHILKLVSGFNTNPYLDQIRSSLIKIAENKQSKSLLRARALFVINEITEFDKSNENQFMTLATKLLQDSSYLVEAASLSLFYTLDSALGMSYARKAYQSSNNSNLLYHAAVILQKDNKTDNYALFEEKIDKVSGYEKISASINFSNYIVNQPLEIFRKGMESLEGKTTEENEVNKYTKKYVIESLIGSLMTPDATFVAKKEKLDLVKKSKLISKAANAEDDTNDNEENDDNE
jgi:aminopeptidase N